MRYLFTTVVAEVEQHAVADGWADAGHYKTISGQFSVLLGGLSAERLLPAILWPAETPPAGQRIVSLRLLLAGQRIVLKVVVKSAHPMSQAPDIAESGTRYCSPAATGAMDKWRTAGMG